MLLSALDQTIVATAMPRIVRDLNGLEYLSWVITAYLLASTVIVPIYGKLSDIYGRKYFILGAVVTFVLGSILSGLSQNMAQLIIFRAIQGLGGGAIFANAFAVIGDLFPPRERGRWQGLFGAVFGLASVIGPGLGGWITDNASWRWNFFVNIPVGILALLVIGFFMPKIKSSSHGRSIDYAGATFLTAGLVSLLLALVWGGNQYTWNSLPIYSLFTIALVSLVTFIQIERKVAEPILPLDLFKNSIFSVSIIIIFLTGLGMFGAILYIPLFAQLVLGTSATSSGTILTPMMLGLVVSSVATGQVISRTGKYKWLAIFGLGLAAFAIFLLSTNMGVNTSQGSLILRMILIGIGLGVSFPVFTLAVQNAFDHSKMGVATASTQLFRSIGGTVGTAILGGVLNSSLASHLGSGVNINQLQATLGTTTSQQPGFNELILKIRMAFASSITEVFLIASLFMTAAFVAALFLKETPLRVTHESAEEAGRELAAEEGNFPASQEPSLF